ncbi:MAG: SEC-C domain-containing protein [Desulfomonile tiedjei]|nr:SEC-C domain-containing protein [Desulfomonile tiedjei]
MKKIKSPWYGVVWIVIWTIGLAMLLKFGGFDQRESIGLILVWAVLVGVTGYLLARYLRMAHKRKSTEPKPSKAAPALNAPCPCGSGLKYKRCCGASD